MMNQAKRIPLLKRIAGSQASGGGNLIKDGRYVFGVVKLELKDGFKGSSFIAEFFVEEAQPIPGLLDERTGKQLEPNAVGTSCSYVLNLSTNPSALGNVKSLVMALLDVTDEAAVDEDDFTKTLDELIGAEQPARGMRIADETYRKIIMSGQNANKPFTAHRWKHVADTPEQVEARRAVYDKKVVAQAA